MPKKSRLGTRTDLGSVTGGTFSGEVDLSSSTHAVVYVSQASATRFGIEVWYSPTPFGESADWFRFYLSLGGTASIGAGDIEILNLRGTKQVHPVPPAYVYSAAAGNEVSVTGTPRRMRLKPATTCSIIVEGKRRIA